MTSVCAIITARNERAYLSNLLSYLRDEGVDAFLIDNDSTDGSAEVIERFRDAPVIGVRKQTYDGCFDLTAQLDIKQDIIAGLRHDWIIHQDADEILESKRKGESLLDLADRSQRLGVTALDFDEFVFLPDSLDGYPDGEYRRCGRGYYFFQPYPLRLLRMFERRSFTGWGDSGGHRVGIAPDAATESGHILRHYIVLSYEHACRKYLGRTFAAADREKGWHHNRIGISLRALDFSQSLGALERLEEPRAKDFSRSAPRAAHFWEW